MVLTTHFIMGASTAYLVNYWGGGWLLMAVASFFSHLLIDAFPHWEYAEDEAELFRRKKWIVVDLILGPLLILLMFLGRAWWGGFEEMSWETMVRNYLPIFLWGGFWGMVPDGFALIYFLSSKNKALTWLYRINEKTHTLVYLKAKPWGILSQVALILACLFLVGVGLVY